MKLSVYLGIAAVFVMPTLARGELVLTGVFDGGLPGGEPKVVELYATQNVDLSQYAIGAANNGGGTDGVELILSGNANAGDYIYIVEDDGQGALGVGFNSYFGFTPTHIFDGSFTNGGAASINGDDAVELFMDASGAFTGSETVVDVFGDINVDGSGQAWEYLDGWAYRNDDTGPDGTTFNIGNWTFSGINVTDGATDNTQVTPPFPIGTYTVTTAIPEPGSTLLLGLFAAPILLRRRR